MADSDEIIFAIAIANCVLIISCGFGTIVYLAWAGGKRLFSDKDHSASHSAEEAEARLQPLHAHAQHSLRSGIAIFRPHNSPLEGSHELDGNATHERC